MVQQEDSGVESDSEGEAVPGATVFVKNLNFNTQEADFKEVSAALTKLGRPSASASSSSSAFDQLYQTLGSQG